jgi:hypothetical protein
MSFTINSIFINSASTTSREVTVISTLTIYIKFIKDHINQFF